MKLNRSDVRSEEEFTRLSHTLIERAMELRCNAYISQAKHKLLMQTIMDISSARHNLKNSNLHLKELDKIKTLFIAGMTHELNNPLASIIGYCELIITGKVGPLTDKQQDYLHNVINSAEHIKNLVSEAMDIAKVEANVVEPHVEHFSLRNTISDVFTQLMPKADDKHIELYLDMVDDIFVDSDKSRLVQCLINLISNAIKYTTQGHVKVTAMHEQDMVYITVSDTGVGLSQEDLQHLFEAFHRGESAKRTDELGTGIGLFLTNKLVKNVLQGSISVESELDKGSSFTISIPVQLEVGKNKRSS